MGAPVVHFEIGCKDKAKIGKFYKDLFDWQMADYGGSAMMIDTAPNGPTQPGKPPSMGINGHINSLGHEPHNYPTVYAAVDDPKATLDKAVKLGGKLLIPPTEVPGMGAFAWLKDPEGTVIGIWKPTQM